MTSRQVVQPAALVALLRGVAGPVGAHGNKKARKTGLLRRFRTVMDDLKQVYGAADGSNLETAPLVLSILEELENWAGQLKASPEVTHKLREFEAAARGMEDDQKPADLADLGTVRRKGPHRSGPSQ